MISLAPVTQKNWLDAAALQVREDQRGFVAPAIGILARGYVYRDFDARVFAIRRDETVVGLAMVRDFDEEPLGYEPQQLLIDRRYQGRGIGSQAIGLILSELRREGRWPTVEVCVKKENAAAIRFYEKLGFADTGYVDPEAPGAVNLVCRL